MGDRWRALEQLYHAALERVGEERAAFLREACDGDETLLRELQSLLARHEKGEDFLDKPALELAARRLASAETLASPSSHIFARGDTKGEG